MTGRNVARKPRPSERGKRISDVSAASATFVTTIESPGEIRKVTTSTGVWESNRRGRGNTDTCGARKGQSRSARTQEPPAYGGAVMGTETAGHRHAEIRRLQAGEDVKTDSEQAQWSVTGLLDLFDVQPEGPDRFTAVDRPRR